MEINLRGFILSAFVLAFTAPTTLYAVVIDDAITPSQLGFGDASVTDGNISINFDGSSGVLETVVVDGVDQLASIEWFYRDNNATTREFPLSDFSGNSPITSITIVSNTIEVRSETDLFNYTLTYKPIGFTTEVAYLDMTLDIEAKFGGTDDVTIFAFFDYDLDDFSSNDSIFGDLNEFTQSSEFTTAFTRPEDFVFPQGFVNPAGVGDVFPSNFEVAVYPDIRDGTGGLTDTLITTFADSNSALDDTDVTFGYQWNFTLGSTGSDAQVNVHTEFQVIPEPSTYALLLLGFGSLLLFGRVGRA